MQTCKYQWAHTYIKHYLSKHTRSLLLSDLEVIKRILDKSGDEFKATAKVCNKEKVDPDARCYYKSLIEGIIKEWHAPASVFPHAATREICACGTGSFKS